VGRPSGLLLDRLVNVAYPFAHASIIPTKSRTVHADFSMPTAIAGVQRRARSCPNLKSGVQRNETKSTAVL
jgi:hypothetical protein